MNKSPITVLYFILVIITPIVEIRNTYVYYDMFNAVGEKNYKKVLFLMFIGILLFILHGLLRYWITVIRQTIISIARKRVKNDYIEKIFQNEYTSFSQSDIGMHISEFTNDVSLLEYKYFQSWLQVIENLFTIIAVGVAILQLRRVVALVIVIGEVVSVVICFFAKKYSASVNNRFFEKLGNFTNSLKDFFSCFFLYKNYGVEDNILNSFHKKNHEVEKAKTEADVTVNFIFTLSKLCTSFIKFIVVGLGVIYLVAFDGMFGEIYIAYQFTTQIFSPTQNIIAGLNNINSVFGIVMRIKKTIHSKTNRPTNSISTSMNDLVSTIEFQNVSLKKGNKEILRDISLKFEPGKKYLLIGRNGSGKSSMLRLLKGYDNEYIGNILIGGVELRNIDSASMAKAIIYINEQVSLFCDTVKNNITMYRDYSDAEIDIAAKMSGLTVPLERVVTDGEINLSSGERRRIELARAYLCQAQMLVLDEAVSTLDVETAYNIEKTMLDMEDRTVVFVSHNFSSSLIRKYDSIILLSDGVVVDQGTHDQLIQRSEMYRNIVKIKSGT